MSSCSEAVLGHGLW
uniref:Uncharacterized protein n=1 Tax=Zea mays TaxID=4577 RepID=C0PA40_MAIZE|nr:unknown [Zea mays]